MLDILFEINGRKVSPNRIGDALEAAVLKELQTTIKKSVGSVKCPKHNSNPKIVVKGRTMDNLNFEISGCCDDLVKEVRQKLS